MRPSREASPATTGAVTPVRGSPGQPVVRGHPLLALPPAAVALVVGTTIGAQEAQRAFLVAGGAVMLVELVCRALARWSWSRGWWPPGSGDPAALLPVAAAATWAVAWSMTAGGAASQTDVAVGMGARASFVVAAIQFASWLVRRVADQLVLGGHLTGE